MCAVNEEIYDAKLPASRISMRSTASLGLEFPQWVQGG